MNILLKDNDIREVVSEMYVTTISPVQGITRQNKCQTVFIEKLVLKQDFDIKIMINAITCSILDSPSTSEYYETEN